MADWQTNRRRPRQLYRTVSHYPEQTENTRVRATETRSPKPKREPVGHHDSESRKVLLKIRHLGVQDRLILDYCYNPGSIGAKPFVKNLLWRDYLPEMKNRNAETQATAVMMIDALLPCYREWVMARKDFPARPWLMFSTINARVWRRTYRSIWLGLQSSLERMDQRALEKLW